MVGLGFRGMVIGLSLVLPPTVRISATAFGAVDDRTEDELVRQGVEARKRQDDAGALEFFIKAYQLHASPRSAAQMGLAEMALGTWIEAENHLEQALAASSDPWITKNRRVLEESLARVRREVGRLDVRGSPPGAEIAIGGQVKGALPLRDPIRVRIGDVRFELRAPGFQPEVRTVQVISGQLARETVHLAPLSAPIVGVTGGASSMNPALLHSSAPSASTSVADEGRPKLRTIGVAMTSAGLLAAGVGLAFGLKARALGRNNSTDPLFNQHDDDLGHRYQTWQWIGYGVGAGFVALGVTTYLIGARTTSPETKLSVSWELTQHSGLAFIGAEL